MHRPRRPTVVLLAVSLTVLAAVACSGGPEQPILNQFFTASRLRDNTSLQNFSTVAFDPQTQGSVTSFSIASVTPEERKPLNVKTFAKALDDARAEDAAYSKRKQEYYNANEEAITRTLKAERDKSKLKGKDAEVQTAWSKFREEGSQVSKRVSDARTKLASESAIVELSFSDQRTPPDYKKYDGELVSKDVTVNANVKLPDGQATKKTLLVTMQRAVLKADKEIAGRWIITSVKDTAAAAGAKTSRL
jgi:hypothetical protein